MSERPERCVPQSLSAQRPRPQPLPTLSYGSVRLRYGLWALRAFLARWGVYVLVAGALLGAGTSQGLEMGLSAAAWLVLPLLFSAAHGPWLLLALTLQTAAGAVLLWGVRHLLWPAQWAQAERALPIARATTLRSDSLVVLLAMTPLLLLYAAGVATVLAHAPAWLQPVRILGVAALALAALGSMALVVRGLQRCRLAPRAVHVVLAVRETHEARVGMPGVRILSAWRALLWLPLWRGPARRTGHTLAGGLLLLLTPSGGLIVLQRGEAWWLALASLLALAVCARVNHLARLDFGPLHAAAASLPVSPQQLLRARRALGLWPLLPALALLYGSVMALGAPALRPLVLLTWLVVCLGSCLAALRAEPTQASTQVVRWLFSLVLCVCVATEVLA